MAENCINIDLPRTCIFVCEHMQENTPGSSLLGNKEIYQILGYVA
jgi:hypothetical protein